MRKPSAEVQDRLARARLRAVKLAPYFADAIYALIPWPTEHLPEGVGMGVTATGVMFYNPKIIMTEWDVEDTATGILHEAEHLYRDHAGRRKLSDYESRMWNECADAELADDLVAMKCKMLPTDILPTHLGQANGLTAEHYYEGLKNRRKPLPTKRLGRGPCGSGAGNPLPNEDKLGGPKLSEKKRKAQLNNMRTGVAKAVLEHGSAPYSLRRQAEEILRPPTIPWETKLAALARRAVAWKRGNLSSTYADANRRQGGLGYGAGSPILAAPVSPVPNVCLVQDTSASVSPAEMAYTLHQAIPILKAAGGRLTFIASDAQVHTLKQVKSVSEIRRSLKGGGGTDFRPVFAALQKLRNRPDVVVFSTDGYGYFPIVQPSWCRVIWLLQCEAIVPNKPPWGASIVVPNEDRSQKARF